MGGACLAAATCSPFNRHPGLVLRDQTSPNHPPTALARRNYLLKKRSSLWQYPAMLGDLENQFSLTRAALSTRAAQKPNSFYH